MSLCITPQWGPEADRILAGLDQKTLVIPEAPDPDDEDAVEAAETLDRERVAWTYCYLFDRQGAIRTGKAFWSRGPGLCFTTGPQTRPADTFPSMRYIEGVQDNYASSLQA